jgi:hypothetical protein
MAAIARSLAEHGTYANPFAPAITGPTALVPPIHPLFLAALMRIFHAPAVMRIAALLPRIATVCYGDAKAGVIGGVLWILAMRLLPQWDVSNTILGCCAFCLLTARNVRRGEGGVWATGAPAHCADCCCCSTGRNGLGNGTLADVAVRSSPARLVAMGWTL